MWSARKSRKQKIVEIEPLRVLHRSFSGWDHIEEFEITKLRFKVKTKPSVYDSTGKSHHIFRDSGVYYDTPKNRELISKIQELESKIRSLNGELSEYHNQIEKVDVSKLHERSLQGCSEKETTK